MEALKAFQQESDFHLVSQDLKLLFSSALLSENLNDPLIRHNAYFSFISLYNFLLKMEMMIDPDNVGQNIF